MMTEEEWSECLRRRDEHERHVRAWEPAKPNLQALRCVQSRHRTLAHLRACQQTWLEACLAFDARENPSLKLLHPWRLFERDSYESVSWESHLAAYLADRARWSRLLEPATRQRAGKINGTPHSIESLTARLVAHEHHHLFTPR